MSGLRWFLLVLASVAVMACGVLQPDSAAIPTLPVGTCLLMNAARTASESVQCSSLHTQILVAHVRDPNTDCPAGTDYRTPASQDLWNCWQLVAGGSPSP